MLQKVAKSVHDDDDDDTDDDDAAPKLQVPKVLSSLGVAVGKVDATTTTTTTQGIPTPPVPKDPVVKRLDITVGSVKCPTEPPDCGHFTDPDPTSAERPSREEVGHYGRIREVPDGAARLRAPPRQHVPHVGQIQGPCR